MVESMFELPVVGADADEAALVAHIAGLETLKAQAAAAQAHATAQLVRMRHAAEAARGVPAARRGKGLAAEVALARRDAPVRGGRHIGLATALVEEMPYTLAALEVGALSEWRATLIVRESACLSVQDRRRLDAELCGDVSRLEGWGDGRVAAEAKTIAQRLDARAVAERAARAPEERCVTIRPAPDTMTYVTVLLPMAQGVSVYATLKQEADACGDGRTRGQVMADVLYERVTGRPAETPCPVSVNLVLTDTTLLGEGNEPARAQGYGPIPAAVARHLIKTAATDAGAGASLRRLYRHPASGALVAMESRARMFPKGLAAFIALRDNTCRTPYCDAPIRHTDHVQRAASDGVTSAANGQGLCEACNYTKEAHGWHVTATLGGDGTHTCHITTPTGHRHRSKAPPLPGSAGATAAQVRRPNRRTPPTAA